TPRRAPGRSRRRVHHARSARGKRPARIAAQVRRGRAQDAAAPSVPRHARRSAGPASGDEPVCTDAARPGTGPWRSLMSRMLWRYVDWRLRRRLPPAVAGPALGDLAEDYARRRTTTSTLASTLWILGEMRSLLAAYRQPDEPRDRGNIIDAI